MHMWDTLRSQALHIPRSDAAFSPFSSTNTCCAMRLSCWASPTIYNADARGGYVGCRVAQMRCGSTYQCLLPLCSTPGEESAAPTAAAPRALNILSSSRPRLVLIAFFQYVLAGGTFVGSEAVVIRKIYPAFKLSCGLDIRPLVGIRLSQCFKPKLRKAFLRGQR
ncbi:hypothetical protein BC628DRAFT_369096 [Trametes gibbosa]|nr:hypothetical protein BC628DRAFT_369096 [Trametes gibbosa]